MNRFENPRVLPWIALVFGLGLTFLIWELARVDSQKLLHEEFESCVQLIIDKIENRVRHSEQILRGTAGVLNASSLLTRQEFHTYIDSLQIEKNYPGIRGIGLNLLVSASQKAALKQKTQKDISPKYNVWPKGERNQYAIVTYLEPASGANLNVFGYDMYSDKARREAMERARDKNEITLTRKLNLVIDDQKIAGLVMFAPVYQRGKARATLASRRENLIGWVFIGFRMQEMMHGILGDKLNHLSDNLGFHIFDGTETSSENQLYGSHDHDVQSKEVTEAHFYTKKTITLAGREWTIVSHSLANFGSYLHNQRSIGIVGGGLFVTLLVTLLFWQLATGRQRAVALARRVNLDLVERERRYRQMFEDNSSISYLVDPVSGDIVDANNAAAQFWGYTQDELQRMSIADINIAPLAETMAALNNPEKNGYEPFKARHRLKNGEIRNVELFVNRLTYQNHTYIYTILHDITDRQIAEEALLNNKQRLRVIIDTAMDAVVQIDCNGNITDWNSRAETMFGWKQNDAIGKGLMATIIPPQLHEQYQENAHEFLDSDNAQVRHSRFEISGLRNDGHIFPIEVSLTTMLNQQGEIEYCAFIHDITSRKRNENALRKARNELENRVFERTTELVRANKRLNSEIVERTQAQEALEQSQNMLRELVAHQDQIRENERKRIAREIHDELGQHLLVLRIDVSMLQRNHGEDSQLQKEVDAVLGHIDTTMKSVRTIINNLRPSVLDLGLFAALEWQCNEFERRSGIHCELTSNDESLELDDNISTVLFRIMQEALNNVLKHAKASHVQISLKHEPGSLQMTVADNGIGLPAIQKQEQKSFGLLGIRERLSVLGGSLDIDSSNNGTTLTVTLPLPNDGHA